MLSMAASFDFASNVGASSTALDTAGHAPRASLAALLPYLEKKNEGGGSK